MKATMKLDGNKVKGFSIDCGVMEALVISKALQLMALNEEVLKVDREIAKNIVCGIAVATDDRKDEQTEPQTCEWCKFYDGENCFSQEPCKVKTEHTERSE